MRNEEDLFQRNEQRRQAAREETKEQAKYYAGQVRDGLGRVARSNDKLVAALSYLSLLYLRRHLRRDQRHVPDRLAAVPVPAVLYL